MKRIKKSDKVKVLSGKYKGKIGVVLSVLPKINKAVVEGVNKVKRHKKSQDPNKSVVEKEMPIDLSKLALCDSKDKDSTIKVSYKVVDEVKIRFNRKTQEKIK